MSVPASPAEQTLNQLLQTSGRIKLGCDLLFFRSCGAPFRNMCETMPTVSGLTRVSVGEDLSAVGGEGLLGTVAVGVPDVDSVELGEPESANWSEQHPECTYQALRKDEFR